MNIRKNSSLSEDTLYLIFALFFISVFLTSFKLNNNLRIAYGTVASFCHARGNFQALRLSDPINYASYKVRSAITPESKVDMSPQEYNMLRVTARYALYPLELNKNWDYFIDFDQGISAPSEEWKRQEILPNILLYAKKGAEFTLPSDASLNLKGYPQTYIFLTFLGITIFYVIVGIAILALIKIPCLPGERFWYLSTSYLLGFVSITTVVWGYLILGGPFERMPVSLICLTVFALLIMPSPKIFVANLLDQLNFKRSFAKAKQILTDQPLLSVAAIALISIIILSTILTPVFGWDAMSHWIIKSKVVFQHKHLDFHYTHLNGYPLLWPLNIALGFLFAGGIYDELAQWTSAAIFLAFIFQLTGGLKKLKLPSRWTLILLITFLLCFMSSYMTSSYAENILFAFLSGTLVAVILVLQNNHDKKYLLLAILMALGLSTSKMEGAVATGIIAFGLASLGSPPFRSRKNLLNAIYIASTCVITAAWLLWINHMGYPHGSDSFKESFSLNKIPQILSLLFISLWKELGWEAFGFFGIFIFFLLIRPKEKTSGSEIFLLRTIVLLFFFTVAAFTKWNMAKLSDPAQIATLARIFNHISPAMILYLGTRIHSHMTGDALREGKEKPPGS